jgi:uncharacterized protein (TIGR03086 family)
VNSGTKLLERAVSYATRSVLDVTPANLQCPTPCHGWNLDMLLRHASESLAALHDATVTGHVALIPDGQCGLFDPVQAFRNQAGRLLAARAVSCPRQELNVGGLPLPGITAECAGAIEIVVHGWDISQACGQCRPIPESLAASLLVIVPLLIPETGRYSLFSPPVQTDPQASLGDQLVAFLGRKPPVPRSGTARAWRGRGPRS